MSVTVECGLADELANTVPRQYRIRAKPIDLGMVAGHATRDASRRPDGHSDPIRVVNASRLAARGACPAPPVGRAGAFEPALVRPSDRLLWLILRRVWQRWRDALVLVQSATVDRWHRDRFGRRWWLRSRRPGRPRIDSPCRDLIGRLADENRLWGAPRIHGELLKLGMVGSERTVSRYLRECPRRPSQTWRTFLANHLGQFTCISPVMSPYASGNDVVDASAVTSRSTPLSDRSVCVESMRDRRLARLGPTHICWLAYNPASLSRPHRHAKKHQPGPAGNACLQPTHGVRAAGRFVPLAPVQLRSSTAWDCCGSPIRDRHDRHRETGRLRLVCGWHVCVAIRGRSEYWRPIASVR
jgi:hypothetical protein